MIQLENVSGLSRPSSSQKKVILNSGIIEEFCKKLSKDGKGTTVSIGPNEPRDKIVSKEGYRIDLQKYNNDKFANFQIQNNTTGGKSESFAALFMQPNQEFRGQDAIDAFTMSLNSEGTQAARLTP
jgi:hypothetical protein